MLKIVYLDKDDEYIRINQDKPESNYIKIEHDIADGLECRDIERKPLDDQGSNFNENEFNKHVFGAGPNKYFCVFRVGKKYKNLGQITGFEKHMQRDMVVPNADPTLTKYNKILIGSSQIEKTVKEYIKGIKLRTNANIARDLVLTTGNGFFNNLVPQEREKWIQENIKFLKDNFGDNCVYACIHVDETTPHIHALIVPKFWDQNKQVYKLRSNVYFDGLDKMRDWQDKYANHMNSKFNNLTRGIKGSKARHMDIKTYYSLITKKLDVIDDRQVVEYAKRNYLLEKRTKTLEYTLKRMTENENTVEVLKKINKLKKNNKIYKETIKVLSKNYGIGEKEILEIVDKVSKSNKNEREK